MSSFALFEKKIEKEKVDQSLDCQINLIHNQKLKF